MRSAHMGNAHRGREIFRAQRPSCTALAQEQSKVLEQHNCLQEWQYKTVLLLLADSQSALAVVQAKRAWVQTGRPRIHEVWTHDNPADLMTKAMTREKLINFGRALNLRGSFFTDLGQNLHSNISYTNHRKSYSRDDHSQQPFFFWWRDEMQL